MNNDLSPAGTPPAPSTTGPTTGLPARQPGGTPRQERVADTALIAAEPARVERYLEASLTPELQQHIVVREKHSFAGDGYENVFLGYDLVSTPSPSLLPSLKRALERHERCMLPAPEEQLIDELTIVRATTTARQDEVAGEAMKLLIYASKLAAYPADIALHVLRTQPDVQGWWPNWHELQLRLDWRCARRRARRRALEAAIARCEAEAAAA